MACAATQPENARLLDSLQTELRRLDREIESGRAQEIDMLDALNARQQESALQEELVRFYRTRLSQTQDSLNELKGTLPELESQLAAVNLEIARLENCLAPLSASLARVLLVERRLSGWTVLDFLLRADSWRELLERRTIISRLRSAQARRHGKISGDIQRLRESKNSLAQHTTDLQRAQQEFEHLQSVYSRTNEALLSEQRTLKSSQAALRRQLDRVRNNRRLLQMQRDQSARAMEAIGEMVASALSGKPMSGAPLNLLKGKLPWPIQGLLVERFGKSKNTQLETVTENPGIELSCEEGEPVRAIAAGSVSSVTWLRGFGNVCIVEHPGAYYSVYARLGQVLVEPNAVVSDTSIIGYPGLSPMSNDYRFHFEIWDRREKQNPLTWLQKR
ncbi:peptidoglycan DD-metalloendopeptidase family protein [bacterium]|nr:peptidoglycan DD-metalloendopeptidase family protein [bacterium]MBU1636228.1 peptidoglycan DD-metalloendopeptidase family protein [bacterium]